MKTEHLNGSIPQGMRPGRRELNTASLLVTLSEAVPKHMRPATREVSELFVPAADRRKHLATALMNFICQEADANGITLLLIARPYGEDGPDEDALVAWYERFGFASLQDTSKGLFMARQVRIKNRVAEVVHRELVH